MQFFGQTHIQSAFDSFIAAKSLPHCVFFGPSGSGKTTFARLAAARLGARFIELDAGNFSISALREALAASSGVFSKVIFIDEIHRLNRSLQDSLLKPLENPGWTLIAATTSDPFYALSRALNSRLMSFEFHPLSEQIMREILQANLAPGEQLAADAQEYLITSSGADARAMLILLNAARTMGDFSLARLKQLRPRANSVSDHGALIISALIKSMRASDVNAAIYYLARALVSGIEPDYIARRLVVFAAEDVGNAQPNALLLASSALSSVQQIGMPEARIILAQVVVFCAEAKKSNASYRAINAAMAYAKSAALPAIPEYLDNNSPAKRHYIYPHDTPNFCPQMQPLAPGVPQFYEDFGIGYEANFALWAQQGRYRENN